MCYIEFTLSQRKSEFYRSLVNSLDFFGGSPRKVTFDNLKAAVLGGSGRNAVLHPEFAALCGHYIMEQEKQVLRPLPKRRFDTDEVVLKTVRSPAP